MLGLAGCGGGHGPSPPPREHPRVTLAVDKLVAGGLVLVADAEGYFARAGVDVRVTHFENGKLALESMLAGDAQVAAAGETPIALNVVQGQPVALVSSVFRSSTFLGLVARRDHGISSVAGLRGKRIGMPYGTNISYFAHVVLTAADIRPGEVTIVDLPLSELPGALLSGKVDAVSTITPYVEELGDSLGSRGVTFRSTGLYTATTDLVADPAYAKGHEHVLAALVQGLLDARTFMLAQPAEARAVIARTLAFDPALLARIWPGLHYDLGLDQAMLVNLEQQASWMVRTGMVPRGRLPNFFDLVDPRALLSVAPSTLTLAP